MKKFAAALFTFAMLFPIFSAVAGDGGATEVTTEKKTEAVPIDIVEMETGYVFESDLNHGGSFGKQDELQNEFEYAHRFQLHENFYARLGVSYDRFDFGNTAAPVPVHLQRGAAVIGIDYMHGADIGAMLQIRPGFYTEEHIGLASFDCPITLLRFWTLQQDKLYLLTGVHTSFLKGGLPVIPLVGAVWIINDQLKLMAVPPDPRLVYSPNDKLDVWVGAELVAGAFRTDRDDHLVGPHVAKLSGTQVDYADYRAGVGLTYEVANNVTVDFGGGYAIQRSFNFHRAGEYYRTDPAPYLRVEFKAKF
ncbi:MAG: hypothetical protein QOI04_1590 [Verrucomicrobiota bacterium]|jgi:hypothetical protein